MPTLPSGAPARLLLEATEQHDAQPSRGEAMKSAAQIQAKAAECERKAHYGLTRAERMTHASVAATLRWVLDDLMLKSDVEHLILGEAPEYRALEAYRWDAEHALHDSFCECAACNAEADERAEEGIEAQVNEAGMED